MNKFTKVIATCALGTTLAFTSCTSAFANTYKVQRGDTLSSIAKKYGTTYTEIMYKNHLTSTVIKTGQVLEVGGKNTSTTSTSTNKSSVVSGTSVVNLAKKYLGIRYVFGGSSPYGFDCSGFVYYVFKQTGKSLSRTTAASYYTMSKKISKPELGDLVFFSNTYKRGISHVGIYIGNGKMISASGNKVQIEYISSSYWKKHFTGYGRI